MADLRHGTPSAYNQKCRCEVCVAGKRERDHDYYLRNRERVKARAIDYYAENREVVRAKSRVYRKANADKIAARKAAAHAANPEPTRKRVKEWQAANPDKVKAAAKRSRVKNREAIRVKSLAYYYRIKAEDPERQRAAARAWAKTPKGRIYHRMAAHRRRGVRADPLAREYAAILLNDPCAYCGEPAVELDHIEPVSVGGAGTWDNLTGACRGCNASKNDRRLLAFVAA